MRTNDGTELFRKLDSLQVFRIVSGGGDSTLGAALSGQNGSTAGASVANVTSMTNFTSGDPVMIIGTGGTELNAITAVTPTSAIPLLYKAAFSQASGARFVEVVGPSLAHICDEGIALSATAPLTAINSAFSSLAIAFIYGYGELTAALTLLGFNIENLQTWLGITEGVAGAGTSGDPYQGKLSGGDVGTQTTQCFRAMGTRHDGKNVMVDFLDGRIEPNGAINLQRTQKAGIPCNIRFTQAVVRIYT